MKVGILTFHASHNYGSMLQAYALLTTIRGMGHECEIINLRTEIQKGLILPELVWKTPKATLSRIIKHPIRTFLLQKKYLSFEKFLSQELNCSQELHTTEEVAKYLAEGSFEAIVVGSDQIWNVDCWDFDPSYILDFNLEFRRIAYAPSLGAHPEQMSTNQTELLKKCWRRFDYLSTREQRGAEYVEHLTGKKCAVVLDPTLLLDKTEYSSLDKEKPIVEEPYLFYYTPREERGTFKFALKYAEQNNMKIVVTQSYPEYRGDNIIYKLDCGPIDFINMVRFSTINVGNSFHLLAFSLIFRKEFIMLSNEQDSRMVNILKPLKLKERLLSPHIKDIPKLSSVDYSKVFPLIERLKLSSLNYLNDSFK